MCQTAIKTYITNYNERYTCYVVVFITLTLFCTPVHPNKHILTFIKLGTNDVNMMTSRRYCFPRYNVFGCFSLKETENLLSIWCKIKIYFTRDHRKSYFHEWLSIITREINFYLTPTFNKYPLYFYYLQ